MVAVDWTRITVVPNPRMATTSVLLQDHSLLVLVAVVEETKVLPE
jgi:hypothetical protein